jgi:hypothetical protein
MFAELTHFQEVMNRVHGSLRNPEDKAKLGEVLTQLQKARAEAEEKVPAILQEKLRHAQKAKAEMEVLAKQLREKQQELEAQKKEAVEKKAAAQTAVTVPSLPARPELSIDPKLGQDLRTELLKTYGGLITRERSF